MDASDADLKTGTSLSIAHGDAEVTNSGTDAELSSDTVSMPVSEGSPSYLRGVSEPNRAKVEAHTQAFKDLVKRTTESVLAAGGEACAIKLILKRRGQFGEWVRDETPFSMGTIERYMNAYHRFGHNRDLAILLGITDLCDLAAPSVSEKLGSTILDELGNGRRFERGEISRLIEADLGNPRSTTQRGNREESHPKVASPADVKTRAHASSMKDNKTNISDSCKYNHRSTNFTTETMVQLILECFQDDPEDFLQVYDAVDCRQVLRKVAERLRPINEPQS